MSAPAPDLAHRYGAPSRARRRTVLAAVVVVALAGLGWLAWAVTLHSRPEVTSQLVAYDVRGQHASTATFSVVRRDATVRASCLLRAYASDHAVVGQVSVPVRSGPTNRRVTATVRTERAATNVDLVGCTTADQAAPG